MSRNKKDRNSAHGGAGKAQIESNAQQTAKNEAAAAEVSVKAAEDVTAENVTADGKDKTVKELSERGAPSFNEGPKTGKPGISLLQNVKEHLFSSNPVFVKAIAIVPILGAATALKNGIMLSGAMFLTAVLLNLLMYPLCRIIPRGHRAAVSFLAAGAVVTPICMLANYFAPTVYAQCSVYLPLLAVCALPLIDKKHYGEKYGVAKTALDAALDGVGFAFAAIAVSIIREIIGYGTLYDRALPYAAHIKFLFAVLPAGALLLLGMLLALFRKISVSGNDAVQGNDGGKTE